MSNQPIIRDVAALGRAAATGATDQSIREVYDLLATAQSLPNDREGWKGLALIRTRLPLIVDRLTAAYPQTRRRIDRVRIETTGGNALRGWLLDAYRLQLHALLQLRREVTTGGYAWAAVLQWSEVNHHETAGFSTRLSPILRGLPATQQLAIEHAITTYLG